MLPRPRFKPQFQIPSRFTRILSKRRVRKRDCRHDGLLAGLQIIASTMNADTMSTTAQPIVPATLSGR